MDEQQEKKKKFIRERIVGRELTAGRAFRYLLLAAACGLIFGLCAAAVFSIAQRSSLRRAENGTEVPETREQETAAPEDENAEAALETETEPPVPETTEDIEALVRQELEQHTFSDKEFGSMLEQLEESAERADTHVVSVQAVQRGTGWFNDPIETEQLAAGVILSTADPEIQILTTEQAVRGADSLSVTFRDGTVQEASVKQISKRDGMAVIAVAKAGLGTEFLSSIAPVRLAAEDPKLIGSMLTAAGAPLGKVHSADFGFVGFTAEAEPTADGVQAVFYADLQADADKGTFLFNMEGELLGLVKPDSGTAGSGGHTACAMGISWLKRLLPALADGKALPYLGILGRTVSAEMEAEQIPRGVFITDVELDSPAYAAGIKSGDIVTAVGETEVHSITGYAGAVSALETGAEVKLSVMRSSGEEAYRELEFTVTAGAR